MSQSKLEPGARLTGQDLSDIDWSDVDLSDAVLTDCTIRDAQLSGVVMQGAKLTGCRLIRCRFAHADLREASFQTCVFADDEGHAGVQFAFSQIDQVSLKSCDLSFARLDRVSAYGFVAEDCNWRGATFMKVDFHRVLSRSTILCKGVFHRCNLELADLSELSLPGGDLSGSSLREATLAKANLSDADLSGCDLHLADLFKAKLSGANLRGAQVDGLDLSELESWRGAKIALNQQYALLSAMGLEIHAD